MIVLYWRLRKKKSRLRRVLGWARNAGGAGMRWEMWLVLLVRGCRLFWGFWAEVLRMGRWMGDERVGIDLLGCWGKKYQLGH
jgi:hypothetical protein